MHQPSYSMLNRWIENDLLDVLERRGVGCIAFTVLAQGLLTNKYLVDIPPNSRAARPDSTLPHELLAEPNLVRVRALADIAGRRGQTLAQLALAWALRDPRVTSLVIGASSVAQLEENVAALNNLELSAQELAQIDEHAIDSSNVDLWRAASDDA
jgi:L-glyceraldehyde 3-phosphate reductase